MNAFWIILTGSLVASLCGILGCYLVLRKMAMVGDAISHSVLPGIVLAYLISGTGASLPMLAGAALLGLLATFLIETFHRSGKLQADAAIGLTFTFLFAVGVIMISLFARNAHIDTDCVLYGELVYVPLDIIVTQSGTELGPKAVWVVGSTLCIVTAIVIFGYRGLFLTTFDPGYAASLGISTAFWHYLLMGMVSVASVVSFESVGAILVVAMLIAPAATAYLLTERFKRMLILSVIIGCSGAVGGYFLAVWLDGSIAAAMTVVLGVQFTLAFLVKGKFFRSVNKTIFSRAAK